MADGTTIEWCAVPGYKPASWNPVGGCSHKSPGCKSCFAERLAPRLQAQGHPVYQGVVAKCRGGPRFTGRMTAAPPDDDVWGRPFRWRDPRAIFVCDMSDLFHPDRKRFRDMVDWSVLPEVPPNILLGTSVEDQPRADARRAPMADIAKRGYPTFVSYEPALGPVDWTGWEFVRQIIFGGETGPRAREAHPDWARRTLDFCEPNGIAYYHKQWGEWLPWEPEHGPFWVSQNGQSEDYHQLFPVDFDNDPKWDDGLCHVANGEGHAVFQRVGKKAAGRLLDAVEHNGFPELGDG